MVDYSKGYQNLTFGANGGATYTQQSGAKGMIRADALAAYLKPGAKLNGAQAYVVDQYNQAQMAKQPMSQPSSLGYSQYDLLSNDASYSAPTQQQTNIAAPVDQGTYSPVSDASNNEQVMQFDKPAPTQPSDYTSTPASNNGAMRSNYGQGLSVSLDFGVEARRVAAVKAAADAQMASRLRANTALDLGISPVFKTIKSARGGYRGTRNSGGLDNPLVSKTTLLGA